MMRHDSLGFYDFSNEDQVKSQDVVLWPWRGIADIRPIQSHIIDTARYMLHCRRLKSIRFDFLS